MSATISAAEGEITLSYRDIVQRVDVELQPCTPTRGLRPYWRCLCGRRCAKMFATDVRAFACRACTPVCYRRNRNRWPGGLMRAAQLALLHAGAPAGGEVPPSYIARHKSQRRMRMRGKLREVLAEVWAALDDHDRCAGARG